MWIKRNYGSFSEQKVKGIVEVANTFSDIETVSFAWSAFQFLENHARSTNDTNPAMGNCLILAMIAFLQLAERYIPEDDLIEAFRRCDDGEELLDFESERWQRFLEQHPELDDLETE